MKSSFDLTDMTFLQVYKSLQENVTLGYHKLKLFKYAKTIGRKLALPIIETRTLSLYKQTTNIATKKAVWNDFKPHCSYKTLVVNMNRCFLLALLVLMRIMQMNRQHAHIVKHTDATDVSVCLNKNAKYHKTMYGISKWGKTGKGWFYGLKLHITTDLKRNLLSVSFTSGNTDDRKVFMTLNKELSGICVADAGYVSQKLAE